MWFGYFHEPIRSRYTLASNEGIEHCASGHWARKSEDFYHHQVDVSFHPRVKRRLRRTHEYVHSFLNPKENT
jgi:hypothetical protein